MAYMDDAASRYMQPLKVAFVIGDPRLAILGAQYVELMRNLGSRWENKLFSTLDAARCWMASAP